MEDKIYYFRVLYYAIGNKKIKNAAEINNYCDTGNHHEKYNQAIKDWEKERLLLKTSEGWKVNPEYVISMDKGIKKKVKYLHTMIKKRLPDLLKLKRVPEKIGSRRFKETTNKLGRKWSKDHSLISEVKNYNLGRQ